MNARRLTPALRQRSRLDAIPEVLVAIPVEGPVSVRVVAQTEEEERRVVAELDRRNLGREVTAALAELRSALADRQKGAA